MIALNIKNEKMQRVYASAKGLIEKIWQNPHERFRHMLVMFLGNHRPDSMPGKKTGAVHLVQTGTAIRKLQQNMFAR